jgi:hypothetical protein
MLDGVTDGASDGISAPAADSAKANRPREQREQHKE